MFYYESCHYWNHSLVCTIAHITTNIEKLHFHFSCQIISKQIEFKFVLLLSAKFSNIIMMMLSIYSRKLFLTSTFDDNYNNRHLPEFTINEKFKWNCKRVYVLYLLFNAQINTFSQENKVKTVFGLNSLKYQVWLNNTLIILGIITNKEYNQIRIGRIYKLYKNARSSNQLQNIFMNHKHDINSRMLR